MVVATDKWGEHHGAGLCLPAVRSLPALPVLVLVAALVAAGCGGSDNKTTSTAAKPKAATEAQQQATTSSTQKAECQKVTAPTPKPAANLQKPTLKLDPSKTYTAPVETSCGTFDIALDVKHDPKTAASFDSLAGKGFYDNTTFHRVIHCFVS